MSAALGLARRGLGVVAPNPAVGCILVKEGSVVGRGWTHPGGRPHAETVALAAAGDAAVGATAYVTLEPCAHTGKTPPCAQALIDAQVARCVVAIKDPDPRVSGKGVEMLEAAGIDVEVGAMADSAYELNRGFLSKVNQGRPLIALKLASSLDGRIALASGESKWITSGEARQFGHMLRAQYDGILVGSGTLIADDPALDCRVPGLNDRSPTPIILDGSFRITPDHKVARQGAIVFHTKRDTTKEQALEKMGVELVPGATRDLPVVLNKLAERGLTRILVEGGGQVHASFLKAGLADAIEHFQAGLALGGDGRAAIGTLDLASLANAPHFNLKSVRQLGPDMLASYSKAE
ncbi:MAG: bifunctional diaminohydroxyphosphoribosylaminopyrimidine deaminase/5-amino-6-(5-phosphoribosylamino)uracil reductase RibD [Alphaproteobacteria bacterium]|nr:bifunctional diaminohydroxyphosphoribosylaminopyrimidine deaminase/5-amino-6-(5-phosphoribosylamino)uracil reductase RibD [Alphaproteobacteria bacterium]